VTVLGAASLLPSRLLITSVLLNPVDAIRTGALLTTEGTAAFGSASLAFFRFTKGSAGATATIVTSGVTPARCPCHMHRLSASLLILAVGFRGLTPPCDPCIDGCDDLLRAQ